MEAMDDKRPVSVVTDGDRAMRQAIQEVIPDCRHRLCSWHLSRNAATNIHKPEFQEDFKRCMQMDCEIDEFENAWDQVVKQYNIEQKPWVLETYSKRSLWAQAYLRGYMFAGASSTQRVEGMNAYFNQFLKQRLRLFEFMVHYDRALGRIRNREAKAEVRTENSFPVLITPLKRLEKHGADMFTRNIFLLFREELDRAGKYIVEKTVVIEGIDHHKYYLSKYGSPEKTWTVDYHPAENRMMCSCLKFESFGIPCCHMICVMKLNHLLCIPQNCVLQRWARQHRRNHQVHSHSKIDTTLTQTACYGILSSLFNEVSYYASHADLDFKEAREVAVQFLWRLKKRLAMTKEDNPNSVQGNRKTKLFGIGDPNIVKTKGNPGGNSSTGKPKRPRKCGRCRVPGHTKRTCPKFPSANRGVGSNSFDKNDYQPSATHCPSEDGYPTPPPSPFTQTRCKRKSTDPAMTHRVKRQLYTNHERTDSTPLESGHDINRATASRDAQVCQNGSFTISEASKEDEEGVATNGAVQSRFRGRGTCGQGS
ncbi:protein FAR1-RELATED SEQUENCE 5-like [Rhododendron vialii]|uniref:protein FAR1-RELATED SEQUENCE 5-like n=1 Tax=Rhododendron vialii TaxID=182163 RepID=UPI00265E1EE5|nr:protein FAR1-RELATED SEQUENCE 5-like [Rhododendron vialii]